MIKQPKLTIKLAKRDMTLVIVGSALASAGCAALVWIGLNRSSK